MARLLTACFGALTLACLVACGPAQGRGSDDGSTSAGGILTGSGGAQSASPSASSTSGAGTTTSTTGATGGSSGAGGWGGGVPTDALDAVVATKLAAAHMPGLATCVVKHGKVAWCKAYGVADVAEQRATTTDTVFLIASISKTLTAGTLMQLWEKGLFQLDADVDPVAPFSVKHPSSSAPITFRELLTHTAGVTDNWATIDAFYNHNGGDPTISLADCMQGYFDPSGKYYSSQNFSANAPGTAFEYSNEGVSLLGYLAQALGGQDFAALSKTQLLAPLGMHRTSWKISDFKASEMAMPYQWTGGAYQPYGHYTFADYPDGGLFTTAPDLARWLAALSAGGTLGGTRVLLQSTVDEMTKIQMPNVAPGQGLILVHVNIDGEDWIGHNGGESGVATDMYYRPSDGLGFVTLMNGDWGEDLQPIYDMEDAIIQYGESLP